MWKFATMKYLVKADIYLKRAKLRICTPTKREILLHRLKNGIQLRSYSVIWTISRLAGILTWVVLTCQWIVKIATTEYLHKADLYIRETNLSNCIPTKWSMLLHLLKNGIQCRSYSVISTDRILACIFTWPVPPCQ